MVINMEGYPSPSELLDAQGFLLFGRENSWAGVWKLLLGTVVRFYLVAEVASWFSTSSNLPGAMYPLGKHRKPLSSSWSCPPPSSSYVFATQDFLWFGGRSGKAQALVQINQIG